MQPYAKPTFREVRIENFAYIFFFNTCSKILEVDLVIMQPNMYPNIIARMIKGVLQKIKYYVFAALAIFAVIYIYKKWTSRKEVPHS